MKIAVALKSELKDRNSRAKLVAGWTGASERTVKNWISGRYVPCGLTPREVLAQHSDRVLNAILYRWRIGRICFGPEGGGPEAKGL